MVTLVSWAAAKPSCEIEDAADASANCVTRPTPAVVPTGGVCHGDQLKVCGLCAPPVIAIWMPVMFPVVGSEPVTVCREPSVLNVNVKGPLAVSVTDGSAEVTVASHEFA